MSDQTFSFDSFQTFGDLLKYLRRREHLTQLELSITVGYSDAQITRLEKNQRRPDLAALKALFIPALHIENEPELIARFLELAQAVQQDDTPAPGLAPYKGLLFFDQSDSEFFFGREILTAHLVDRVSELTRDSSSRFLAVVGASGSGKSSLVRAGLAVALKQAGWDVQIFTPGTDPSRALEIHVKQNQVVFERLLVIVDQFEETFTLCHDESERVLFIEKLIRLAQELAGKIVVVIALRADFYSHCAQYPLLRQWVAAEQEYIGPMTARDLRCAIEEPAKRGGWEFEPGLVDLLLQDIGAHDTLEPEPGALPLLSHALLATWERRRGRTLTRNGYLASGGVRGAIAETAENVFSDQFNQAQQELARDLFLRLTELGEGTEDTRRRAALNELVRQSAEATQLRAVLNTLAEARLITLNEDSAEVAHEALIREWQRLHEWLTQDREGLLLHRHLTESSHAWEVRGHDPAELYRGARLAQVREWAVDHEERLNTAERGFIHDSINQEEHNAMEQEAQRQRELEAAQKLAETERQSLVRLRLRNRLITAVGVIAIILAIVAFSFSKQSNVNAVNAEKNAEIALNAQATAQTSNAQAIADFTRSEAQRLAVEANSIRLNNGDPNLVALLAIQSLNIHYTPSGDAVLSSLASLQVPPRVLSGHTDHINSIELSPDGNYLATASNDKTARLWNLATGETIQVFSGHTDNVTDLVFTPDGKTLLTTSVDGTAHLWNIATGKSEKIFSAATEIYLVAFSPDGQHFVTAGPDGEVLIWDVTAGKTVELLSGHTKMVTRVAYSPDGKYVLTGSNDNTARLWDAATGEQVETYAGHANGVSSLAFSPDGKYFATGDDYVVRLWNIATGQIVREFSGHKASVSSIQLSPDGQLLLTGSRDQTVRLWNITTGETIRVFGGNTDWVEDVTFTPDGKSIIAASDDTVIKIWNLQTFPGGMQFAGSNGPVWQASFSPDGRRLVTTGNEVAAQIWDTATGQKVMTLPGHAAVIRGAIFSPNGNLVLTTSVDSTAILWDAASGKELRQFHGHTDIVNRGVFSPNGKHIVTTSYDGTAKVWDAETAQTILTYTRQGPGHVNRIAFSPDGQTVVTSGDDGTARIWDPLSGKDLMVFRGHTDIVAGVAFSSDGKYLVTSSFDGSVRLWDVATGKALHRFPGHPDGAFGVDFSPDRKYVLSGGADGTARLWNVQTGEEVRRFIGHTGWVRNVTFSPDGKYILTASEDNTARVWLVDLNKTLRDVCSLLTRDLTSEERLQFDISDQKPTCPVQ
jgi:WD40 repeat protein/transcriptional regulator with XRE-family HTH domain